MKNIDFYTIRFSQTQDWQMNDNLCLIIYEIKSTKFPKRDFYQPKRERCDSRIRIDIGSQQKNKICLVVGELIPHSQTERLNTTTKYKET